MRQAFKHADFDGVTSHSYLVIAELWHPTGWALDRMEHRRDNIIPGRALAEGNIISSRDRMGLSYSARHTCCK